MLVFGKNVVEEILKNDKKIHKAYIYKNFNEESIVFELQKRKVMIEYVDKRKLDELAPGNHQGIIVSIPDYQYSDISDFIVDDSFIVILDHIEDPHNFGAIIRSCEAAKVTGIVIPKDRSTEVNSTVMKVSAGALENVSIAQVTNITTTIKDLQKQGFWVVGTDMEGTPYYDIDFRGKMVLVIGNEGKGMSRLVKESCDFIATIPMKGDINSLNASVATGIVVFEALRQRK